jgi:hypothetical protein
VGSAGEQVGVTESLRIRTPIACCEGVASLAAGRGVMRMRPSVRSYAIFAVSIGELEALADVADARR